MFLTERDAAGRQFQSLQETSLAETPLFLETPFAEVEPGFRENGPLGFTDGGEAFSPFAPESEIEREESETDRLLAEALGELRDEAFDEAVAFLAEETESAVADRFTDEAPGYGVERERFADLHLASVRYEAERYFEALESGLQGVDLQSLDEAQLESKLDQFDPQAGELSPAGEEFIGGLIRKAKKAVKFVVKTAGKLASPLLGPVLGRLKALIRPLLKRVLSIAIGRLPAPLRPAAKQLADRLKFEAEGVDGEAVMSPANFSDLEELTESFDAALAEAAIGNGTTEAGYELEHEDEWSGEGEGGQQLERLGEARGALIDALQSGDEAAVTPAIEQFVPVLLGALKLGINLVGRSKVVGFLAKYLGQLIKPWVGPQAARPLSNAIVDIGLKLVSLEAEDGAPAGEAAPVALASVIEDTVRRLAESESYVFEDEELTQLAVAEAFGGAVATHFPSRYVQPRMRQAATLGGTFVARRPRSARSYSKYSRIPEIEITPQIADAIPTYGGASLGSALRAAGIALPLRARIHLYQASPGSTVSAILRTDRGLGRSGAMPQAAIFHPLTPVAAGQLLREPGLGARAPAAFLRSRRRLGAGQRIYALQPLGNAMTSEAAPPSAVRAAAKRLAPSRTRVAIDRRRGRISVALYFSEGEAQRIAQAIREGRGHATLLQGLIDGWRRGDGSAPYAPLQQEDGEDGEGEDFAPGGARLGKAIKRALLARLRRWAAPALARWAKQNVEAFVRAAADPANGVTVKLRLGPIPGLDGNILAIARTATGPAPNVAIGIVPGYSRP